MFLDRLFKQGKMSGFISMAEGIANKHQDIIKDVVRESMTDFCNVEHKLEFVLSIHGIEFINDSKSTNVNSAWYALETINNGIIWIVGGVDKGNDYSILKNLVKEKVKAIICLGVDNSRIIKAFKRIVPSIVEARSAKEAVAFAYRLGKKGDTVLLSPCCASFDLFENYEDRGQQFKRAVRQL